MDCPEIEAAVLRGAAPAEPGLGAHLEGCPSCRFLVEGGGPVAQALAGSAAPVPVDLPAFPAERLGRERGPLAWARSRSRPERMLPIVAMMALAIGVYFQTYHLRPDWDTYPL